MRVVLHLDQVSLFFKFSDLVKLSMPNNFGSSLDQGFWICLIERLFLPTLSIYITIVMHLVFLILVNFIILPVIFILIP